MSKGITNAEIIAMELLSINRPDLIDLEYTYNKINTYAGHQANGKQVKKGEKALFTTQIWKPCNYKIVNEAGETETQSKLRLVKAAFFTNEQTEPIQDKESEVKAA